MLAAALTLSLVACGGGLGTSQTMYARYERGANELPIRHLIALCKYYNHQRRHDKRGNVKGICSNNI